MASIGSEDGDVGFQIAPMVDVVFVLMLFFMASAGSQVAERELNINLPGSKTPSAAQNNLAPVPIMVDISADGKVSANGTIYGTLADEDPKALPKLRGFFKTAIEAGNQDPDKQDPVIIRPDADTRHERIMDVLNAAGASGIKNLTFN